MKAKLKDFLRFLVDSDDKTSPQAEVTFPDQVSQGNTEIIRTIMEEPTCRLTLEEWPTDIILVNDVSGSMAEKDCVPSRLEASKKASTAFVKLLSHTAPESRIAIIAFNSSAKVILPFTSVYTTETILKSISSLYVHGGTNIAAALKAARALFEEDSSIQRNRKVLLLTDGHGGNPLKQATLIKEQGTHLEVIGVGGKPQAVKENVLRQVATTDVMGVTHYRFIDDSDDLVNHYRDIATGIVFRGNK